MTEPERSGELLDRARRQLPSGHYLPAKARATALRVLIIATEHDPSTLEQLADDVSLVQLDWPFVKPVLLLRTGDVSAIRRRGFTYETAVDPRTWHRLDPADGSYETYLQQRVIEMVKIYDPQHTVVASPGVPLPRSLFSK